MRLPWIKNNWLALIVFFVVLLCCNLMLHIVAQYVTDRTDIDFLLTKQHIVHLFHYRWAFYLHIFPSLAVLGAGLTQFSGYIFRRSLWIHHLVGKIYVGSVLLVCGPGALIMAFYANGTWLTKCSFLLLSVLWIIFTGIAWQRAKSEDWINHAKWMIRSYALTFSAITLRLMQYGFATYTNIPSPDSYQIVAWPSWLLNWAIAEFIILWISWKWSS